MQRSTRARRPTKPATPEPAAGPAVAEGEPLPGGASLARMLSRAAKRFAALGEEAGNKPAGLTFAAVVAVLGTLGRLLAVWSTPEGERLRAMAHDFGNATEPD